MEGKEKKKKKIKKRSVPSLPAGRTFRHKSEQGRGGKCVNGERKHRVCKGRENSGKPGQNQGNNVFPGGSIAPQTKERSEKRQAIESVKD